MEHIGVKYLYVRDKVSEHFKLTSLQANMIADTLTKAVSSTKNTVCAKGFGLTELP